MSLKDKLEIGLKPDAPYRPDNLPDFQRKDPACEVAGQPGESPRLKRARKDCDTPAAAPKRRAPQRAAKPRSRRRAH